MKKSITACQQSAITKAQSLGGAKLARQIGRDTYEITGSRGDIYTVTARGGSYRCTCPAGTHGQPACYHAAAVWQRRMAEGQLPSPAVKPVSRVTSREAGWGL